MITFWGATDEVTGSMTFLDLGRRLILVDCGLNQGLPETEMKNEMPLPVHPLEINTVLVTHAHLDHSGYLPRLVKKGFAGEIFCTPATAKLIRIILEDSAGLMDENFYNKDDVKETLKLIRTVDWNEKKSIGDVQFEFLPAGHILGASSVLIEYEGKKIIFSGDIGVQDDPLIPGPSPCRETDMVVLESTYGGKLRQGNREKELATFLETIARDSRIGIIASFAVARAQMLLFLIHDFLTRHPETKLRLVMDSPMMKEANKIYQHYSSLTKDPQNLIYSLDDIEVIQNKSHAESLMKSSGPIILLSSSGMLTGGRITNHLERWQDEKKAILYLPGYQSVGTPGRKFAEGKRIVQINGHELKWQGEIWTSEAFSSHADQKDLLQWVSQLKKSTRIFLNHGEEEQKLALKEKLIQLGFKDVAIPKRNETQKFL
jgi:metallo-beta-lactamase family protein